MKVFCAIIAATAAISFASPAYTAAAENGAGVYARAEVTNAYFCSDADLSTALFALPYSYCVEVISEYGLWYYAKYSDDYGAYRALYGYVLKSNLNLLDEAPQTEWLYYTLTVTYSQGSSGSLPTLSDITATAAFYGNYYSGASGYSYVYCQGSFGYISGAIEDYTILEMHTEEETSSAESGGGADGKVIAAVVLGILAAAALLILLMSGRKGKYRGSG